ncbi:hypothetical protein SAMN02745216_00292 [Desulfatibacillum alkenivorans DSM 16219]|uniref:Immunity protein 50 n=1 Tax=Desulfatibacillum alkenivorans DSM 16219 TaxID=1121393 RepID=A0A1M6CPZ0_9BACT|nr:hypothetical protein [Desulfatibacillum alkenivorans]SHI62864.1 hypothetical protein SAMN02745216_00292 [Desulfatibacillum alkenivorans DSM 16219]
MIEKICWHDTVIHKALEIPSESKLLFEVDYPEDWDSQRWEIRIIKFEDLKRYEIHEGPFNGSPTILQTDLLTMDEYGFYLLRIETNAGHRLVQCKSISILKGRIAGLEIEG